MVDGGGASSGVLALIEAHGTLVMMMGNLLALAWGAAKITSTVNQHSTVTKDLTAALDRVNQTVHHLDKRLTVVEFHAFGPATGGRRRDDPHPEEQP